MVSANTQDFVLTSCTVTKYDAFTEEAEPEAEADLATASSFEPSGLKSRAKGGQPSPHSPPPPSTPAGLLASLRARHSITRGPPNPLRQSAVATMVPAEDPPCLFLLPVLSAVVALFGATASAVMESAWSVKWRWTASA